MVAETKMTSCEKALEKLIEVKKEEKVECLNQVDTSIKLKSINIKIPEDLHRKLKSKSALEGESTGSIMKRLIADYIG